MTFEILHNNGRLNVNLNSKSEFFHLFNIIYVKQLISTFYETLKLMKAKLIILQVLYLRNYVLDCKR